MAEPARVMFVRAGTDHDDIEAFIQGNTVLNAQGGGPYFTVDCNLTGDINDPVLWVGLSWNMPTAWFGQVTAFVNSAGWVKNTSVVECVFADYRINPPDTGGPNRPDWQACLDDQVRKPDALIRIVDPAIQ